MGSHRRIVGGSCTDRRASDLVQSLCNCSNVLERFQLVSSTDIFVQRRCPATQCCPCIHNWRGSLQPLAKTLNHANLFLSLTASATRCKTSLAAFILQQSLKQWEGGKTLRESVSG